MASISSSNASLLPSWRSESNSTSLRDASFSSYVNSCEEKYIHSLLKSSQNLNHRHHQPRKNKAEDAEIDVFRADKYFSGGTENELNTLGSAKIHLHHQNRKDHIEEASNRPQTPSNYSESSSWNSQSALLRRMQRTPSRSNNNNSKPQGKKVFLPCCSCSDKSTVDVEDELTRNQGKRDVPFGSIKTSLETAEITRMNKLRLERQSTDPFFLPPVSDSPARILNDGVKKIHLENEEQEYERRKSLEVFGSSEMDDHGIVERRLNMLSWDAIPRVPTEEIIHSVCASGPPSESYKDTESDASSDLFEIECLSCSANPVVVGPRHPSDGSATPTTCYAPSEASIEWSVVTASAVEFSAVSDSEDQRSAITSVNRRKMPPKMNPSSKMPSMLLGCKSQKAVRVAGEVHRMPTGREKLEKDRRPRYSDSFLCTTRSQAEAKKTGFGQKQRKEAALIAPRPPRWSHSSHASDLLYIQ